MNIVREIRKLANDRSSRAKQVSTTGELIARSSLKLTDEIVRCLLDGACVGLSFWPVRS